MFLIGNQALIHQECESNFQILYDKTIFSATFYRTSTALEMFREPIVHEMF